MKTVGSVLREARLKKGITLEEVADSTKIQIKFLTAIEADNFSSLPSISYAKGFVRNYGEYLGLPTATLMAFFRRQTQEVPKSSFLPPRLARPLDRRFQLTPARFLTLLLVGLTAVFLLYLGRQYLQLQQPPQLTIESLPQFTNQKRVEVKGQTDSDATVTINGISVLVRGGGEFFDQVLLESGINKITIVATSRFGKSTTVTREIGYQP